MTATLTPDNYRYWQLDIETETATLSCPDVVYLEGEDAAAGDEACRFWLELADALERLRFGHPGIGAVLMLWPERERIPAADPLAALLAEEVRLAMEDASAHSGQVYVSCLVDGAPLDAAALAAQYLVATDTSAVAAEDFDEPALARLRDKRALAPDGLAALRWSPAAEAVRAAAEHGAVDELAAPPAAENLARQRARAFAACSDRPPGSAGVALPPAAAGLALEGETAVLRWRLAPATGVLELDIAGPADAGPEDAAGVLARGAGFWPLALARDLDMVLLQLRCAAARPRLCLLRSRGDTEAVARYDNLLLDHRERWLVREVILAWKRVLWRLDLAPWRLVAVIEAGSCFCGSLLELVLGADAGLMTTPGDGPEAGASVRLTGMNFGPLPALSGRTRLQQRLGDAAEALAGQTGLELEAGAALAAGLVGATGAGGHVLLAGLDGEHEAAVARRLGAAQRAYGRRAPVVGLAAAAWQWLARQGTDEMLY